MATDHEHFTQAPGPSLDAAATVFPLENSAPNPFGDLVLASKNYWAGQSGREDPPLPTYRTIHGRLRLGRYMDPYGCQAHMRVQRNRWRDFYVLFFSSLAISLVLGPETDFLGLVLVAAIMAPWYFGKKALMRRKYDRYFAVQAEILRTGQPVWMPYDRERLKLLDKTPLAMWP